MSPAISVLVPVYNAEKYIEECLSSISKQTFGDFEIICLDDGSQDSSAKVLASVSVREPRLRVITQPNAGVAVTRNRLLDAARGKYVAFVDADDWVEPDYLQSLYFVAEQTQADITKCFFKEFDEVSHSFQRARCAQYFYKTPGCSLKEKFLGGYYDSVVWGKLWRLDFLRQNNIAFLPGQVAEDLAFVVQGFCLAEKIAVVHRVLYVYRKGVVGCITSSPENMAVGILRNLLHLGRALRQRGVWPSAMVNAWIGVLVWGICRFRKFPLTIKKKHYALLQEVWQVVKENAGLCTGTSYWRWRLLLCLVNVCGWRSLFFWTKVFR